MSDDTESIGSRYNPDGTSEHGTTGSYCMVHVDDAGISLGADVVIEWLSDTAGVLTSPHTPTRLEFSPLSEFVDHAAGRSVPQHPVWRKLDGLPRGTKVQIPSAS